MKGQRERRGSGLTTDIKDNILFRDANIDLCSKDDEITESLIIKIQTRYKPIPYFLEKAPLLIQVGC